MVAVEVRKYSVLVFEAAISALLRLALLDGGVGTCLEGGAAAAGERSRN